MNKEAEELYLNIRNQWNKVYEYENKINQIKLQIKANKLLLFKTCQHVWEYDSAEPFDSRCKYKCKFCHLPKKINYI